MVSPREILSTKSFRQSTITIVATIVNGGLGAVFYFLLARLLGASEFGVFSLVTTTIALLAGIVDLGTDQGIVRFIPKYREEPDTQNKLIKLALEMKLFSGLLLFILVIVLAHPIAHYAFAKDQFAFIMPLIGIGVITQILFSFSTSLSQSLERYFLWSGLFIGTNFIRLIAIIAIYYFGFLTAYSSSVIYILLPLFGFITSFLFFNGKFLFSKGEFGYIKDIFKFNRWVLGFVIIATIGSRLDTYFTARFLTLASVGIYSLAGQVVSIFSQLTSAISAVTSPKFSSFDTRVKNITYVNKATLMTSASALAAGIALVIFAPFIFSLAGHEYTSAFIPLVYLILALGIFLSTSPVRDSILYYFGKPQFFFWQGIIHIVIVSVSSFYLIPRMQITGTAIVVLIGQIFIAVSSVWYYIFKIKTND